MLGNRSMLVAMVIAGAMALAGIITPAAPAGERPAGQTLDSLAARVAALEQRIQKLESRFAQLAPTSRPSSSGSDRPVITIASPVSRAQVGLCETLEGVLKVDDIGDRAIVIGVHPIRANLVYIQSPVSHFQKTENGYEFSGVFCCGTKDRGLGEPYEVMALLVPKGQLAEGDTLDKIDPAIPRSAIRVTRSRE